MPRWSWSAPSALLVLLAVSACVPGGRTDWSTFPASDQALVVPAPGPVAGPLRIDGDRLVDSSDRVVVLRGTNLVKKSDPYLATTVSESTPGEWPEVFDGDDFDYLHEMGFNAVRLGVWYHRLEPEVGTIDREYLDRVDEAVRAFEDNGIYVLLDFHQDVFHGMPDWATTDAAAALGDDPPGFLASIGWAAQYMSPRSLRQWGDLLGDVGTATDPGVSMWEALGGAVAAMAQRFEGRANIAGVEILNEPFPGIDYLRCVLGGCPDVERRLLAGYQVVIDEVRAVAPTIPLWVEPIISAPHYGDTTMAAPVDGQVGFAWHAYCSGTDGGTLEPVGDLEEARCNLMMETAHSRVAERGAAWNAPTMMTEFGASLNPLDVNLVTAEADEYVGSWLHWAYGYYRSDETDSALSRVYPEATAGIPGRLSFDRATGAASYGYRASGEPGVTSLSIPSRHYPDGYEVTVAGATVTSQTDAAHLVLAASAGADVRVTVRRRN
ncbi:MAG: cellulase family glycosylhydrolase [Microthrixaceae bacterium]|nr:cellulase family glycosylhydrolase [Microthrixaceae bacterium]MCO5321202.1 cellulase family glycosylhydrolase [Microthrixaceae bacterium]